MPSGSEQTPAPASRVETGQAAPTTAAGGAGLLAAVIAGGVLTAAVAGFTATYDSVSESDGLTRIDRPVLDWMVSHRTPALNTAVTWFTDIGGPTLLPIIATVVTVLLAWRWRSWTPVAFMVVATAGSLAMTTVGKDYTGRLRPDHSLAVPPFETSPSFPSGHTLNSTVIAIVLSYLVVLHVRSRRARTGTVVALAVYAVLMGLSRVYLGHHWFTDVLAGWTAGAAWALALVLAHRLLLAVQRRRRAQHGHDDPPATMRPAAPGRSSGQPSQRPDHVRRSS
jgi:membrane-associated phospholipid phosphatase